MAEQQPAGPGRPCPSVVVVVVLSGKSFSRRAHHNNDNMAAVSNISHGLRSSIAWQCLLVPASKIMALAWMACTGTAAPAGIGMPAWSRVALHACLLLQIHYSYVS